MEDHDWLDQRMAVDAYVPDDGFTARVIERLPAKRPRAVVLRQRILAASVFLAVCLMALHVVPLVYNLEQFTAHHSPLEMFARVATFILQPVVQVRAAIAIVVLAFASIPLLRRWA
jgi:hypothetical protein